MNGPIRRLAAVVAVLFLSLLVSTTYIQVVDAAALRTKPTNTRTLYSEFGRERGPLIVSGDAVARSVPSKDEYTFQRTYPGGPVYAPVTGYYSIVSGPHDLEATENSYLAGTADRLFYRRISDLLTGKEPVGAQVELTIQARAQEAAYKALGNQRGAVVALDPRTGDILAMVSKPSYDPDQLATHDRKAATSAYTRLEKDDADPLINRAIGALYPPGSVFKVITSAAALANGYTPDSELDGPAALKLPGVDNPLDNDDRRACGPNDRVSLVRALQISCNTAFASLGLDLGEDVLEEQAQKFGFGQKLSVPLTVAPSRYPPNPGRPELARSAIGQQDVQVTPLQVAMVAAGIANGGVVMRPNLVRRVRTADQRPLEERTPERLSEAVTPEVARQLTTMMEAVVTSGTGTRAQIDGVRVAGKTGTAQHGAGEPPHAWFTSFAPADDPKVAVAVVVEDGGNAGSEAFGGTVSAPIAKAVMEAVLR